MLSRLFGIMYMLLNKETVTAKELAEHFEVSVRTIYRDVEVLSEAGIPVYARKGKNGGICLMEHFVLNKMLITEEEQQQILSALLSVGETTASEEKEIVQKLGNFFKTEPVNWIAIDFSDWGSGQKQLYEDIKRAILTSRVISFDYYGQNREMSRRIVEPVQLLFKEYTWYLSAYCRERKAPRIFKLTRIKRLEVLEECFEPREEWYQKEDTNEEKQRDTKGEQVYAPLITMWIDKKEAYRVYDRFGESDIEILEDGNFMVRVAYPLDEWVYSLILSFGASAKVLEPLEIRDEIRRRIAEMKKIYDVDENLPY
ncbi:MAG: YafY family transcriptional regulator [Lachnospiraceae bacterium]|nr:YafY family transcriptional regulator [Lachnospiraceae bacterium]